MLTTLCWPGSFSYDPIADPQNVSAETCVSDHLKPYIDDGINQIKDPFVSMGALPAIESAHGSAASSHVLCVCCPQGTRWGAAALRTTRQASRSTSSSGRRSGVA